MKTTGLALALIASCGGAPGGDVVAVFSNPELTIPQADGFAEFSYMLSTSTDVAVTVEAPADVQVFCSSGVVSVVTCTVEQTWVIGDGGEEGGQWLIPVTSAEEMAGAAAGSAGVEVYRDPSGSITVPAGAIVATVRNN